VRQGDKRIILVEGEAAGAVTRVPPEGEARANLHVGGRAVSTTLTARESEICECIGPTLREQGLVFVGIDVIGDYMTEINVTSPTGLQESARLDGNDISPKLIYRSLRTITGILTCAVSIQAAIMDRSFGFRRIRPSCWLVTACRAG